jgi:hypothetical protein
MINGQETVRNRARIGSGGSKVTLGEAGPLHDHRSRVETKLRAGEYRTFKSSQTHCRPA